MSSMLLAQGKNREFSNPSSYKKRYYFFIFEASNPEGQMRQSGRSVDNMRLTYKQIVASGQCIPGGLELLDFTVFTGLGIDEAMLRINYYGAYYPTTAV